MKARTLEVEIQMENAIREIRNYEIKKLKAILEPFIDKKIRNADGSIIKRAKKLFCFDGDVSIEPLKKGGYAKMHVCYVKSTDYSLSLYISINYNGGSYEVGDYYCEYKSCEFYFGDIKDSVLRELGRYEDMPMLNAQEQRKQYDKVQRLNKELDVEKSKLFYGLRDKKYL